MIDLVLRRAVGHQGGQWRDHFGPSGGPHQAHKQEIGVNARTSTGQHWRRAALRKDKRTGCNGKNKSLTRVSQAIVIGIASYLGAFHIAIHHHTACGYGCGYSARSAAATTGRKHTNGGSSRN